MVDAVALNKGSQAGVAIAGGGANNDTDILCVDRSTLVVQVDMTGAAVGDLGVQLNPYEADNATIMPVSIPPIRTIGPNLSGGHDYFYAEYDVSGLDKVRLRITNNNAGAQTITRSSWRLA